MLPQQCVFKSYDFGSVFLGKYHFISGLDKLWCCGLREIIT